MDIQTTDIGTIQRGIDGSDQYMLVTRRDDDITPEQAIEWLLPQVYQQTRQEAGGYFCTTVRAVMAQYSTNVCICTVEHRYDV